MLRTVLTVVQVFVSLGIVALVLLQRGRGADAGAGFGAGASGSVFGARGATTGLSRSTAVFAAIFMVNSLALAWLGTRPDSAAPGGLLGQPTTSAPAAPQGAGTAVTPAPVTAPPTPAALPDSVPVPG
jgi:preprotein translocase subunit SecG